MPYYDLDEILFEIEKRGLSAYEISANLKKEWVLHGEVGPKPLSEAGILKILNKKSEPRQKSLEMLYNYLWPEKVGESLVKEESEEYHKNPRLEELIAGEVSKEVMEALRPYLEEFQESHKSKSEKIASVNNLLRSLAIAIGKLQKTVNTLESEIKEIKEVSKESNEILTGN